MLETALTSGFLSMGMDVMLLGPMPTPAVGMLTRSMRADLGVMISASHNPYEDNGIKLFGPDGFKLSDDIEAEIEARLAANELSRSLAPSAELGRAEAHRRCAGPLYRVREIELPQGPQPRRPEGRHRLRQWRGLQGRPDRALGIGRRGDPDGRRAQWHQHQPRCGAMHPERLKTLVRERGADLGIALDGDADRVIVVDERGQVVDGDQLMGVIARSWSATGRLKAGCVTATVMSNLGLERFLDAQQIALKRTPVGDRYVVEEMRRAAAISAASSPGTSSSPTSPPPVTG